MICSMASWGALLPSVQRSWWKWLTKLVKPLKVVLCAYSRWRTISWRKAMKTQKKTLWYLNQDSFPPPSQLCDMETSEAENTGFLFNSQLEGSLPGKSSLSHPSPSYLLQRLGLEWVRLRSGSSFLLSLSTQTGGSTLSMACLECWDTDHLRPGSWSSMPGETSWDGCRLLSHRLHWARGVSLRRMTLSELNLGLDVFPRGRSSLRNYYRLISSKRIDYLQQSTDNFNCEGTALEVVTWISSQLTFATI